MKLDFLETFICPHCSLQLLSKQGVKTMNEKFKNVPKDNDTVILFEVVAKFGKFDAMYQKWLKDGIYGKSFIFLSSDIANLDDEMLKKEIQESPMVSKKSSITVSRKEKYTFVNFNFKESD